MPINFVVDKSKIVRINVRIYYSPSNNIGLHSDGNRILATMQPLFQQCCDFLS